MSNQRYAGPIRHGTNLTPAEEAEIAGHIIAAEHHMEEAERLMQRRARVLREIDAENARLNRAVLS